MKQEQSLPSFEDFSSSQAQKFESNQQIQQDGRSPNKKKKLTHFITTLLYRQCPKDKRSLFSIFWQDYSKMHQLDPADLKERKTLERRFNEILNTLQASGLVKKTNRIVDVVSQIGEEYYESGVEPGSSRKNEDKQYFESVQKQIAERQKRIEMKTARRDELRQMLYCLREQIKSNRLRENQEQQQQQQYDLRSILVIPKSQLPEVVTLKKKGGDHQILLTGQFAQVGQMIQFLKYVHGKKQQIKEENEM